VSRSPSIPDEPVLPQAVQESLAGAMKPAELGTEQRERLRRRIVESAHEQAPEGTRTVRAEHGAWIQIAPFIEIRELRRDEVAGTHMTLMRMQPGGVIPAHRHEKEEEFLVLEGECHIGTHKLGAGDVHIAAAGSWHEPVTTRSGVLVLLRGEYPHPSPAA
jgi:quercetin dioxygenase-like cupin family protein